MSGCSWVSWEAPGRSPQDLPSPLHDSALSSRSAGFASELRDKGLAGRAWWSLLSVDHVHGQKEGSRLWIEALHLDGYQPLVLQILFNHMPWHVTPAETGLKKRMLGSQICQSPGQR